jgi:rhamnose utilization protein RhaD (predicted bifunctional aldolase and dehydrogenase)
MFDYVAYNGIIQDRHWADTQNGYETELSIVNPNSYSESIDTTNKMLRLQNTSHAVITNKSDQTFYNKLKAKANPAFTLSISFKADFHPDDERTVFQFANLYGSDQNYTPQEGILIRDHELFIGPNTMSLEDDHINNITITYSILTGETFGNAFVYVDGTPEAVFKIKPSDIIPTTSDIYLGCSYYK